MELMSIRNIFLGIAIASCLMAANPAVEQAKKKIAEKKYDEAIAQLESAYKAKPAPDVKKALAEAYMAKADHFMNDPATPPRVKYPTALRSYREVLKYDKDNAKAKQSVATIEGIYKSMGRPIPQ
jgi:tetratricopeptide (TPR) repeat protein